MFPMIAVKCSVLLGIEVGRVVAIETLHFGPDTAWFVEILRASYNYHLP